jgi:Fe-S-cluster containining protein
MATPVQARRRERKRLPVLTPPDAPAGLPEPRPCLTCGLCCTYIAVAIDAPDSVRTATEILWHLYHDHVSVYRDSDDEWMVQFETRCRHLLPDNKCAIYETRPPICRTYSETTCEVNAEDEGTSFYSAEAFLKYLEKRSRRIYGLIAKRFMPGPEHLAPRTLSVERHPPSFEQRYLALRQR